MIAGVELLTLAEVDDRPAVNQHAPPPDEPPAAQLVSAQRDDKGCLAASCIAPPADLRRISTPTPSGSRNWTNCVG